MQICSIVFLCSWEVSSWSACDASYDLKMCCCVWMFASWKGTASEIARQEWFAACFSRGATERNRWYNFARFRLGLQKILSHTQRVWDLCVLFSHEQSCWAAGNSGIWLRMLRDPESVLLCSNIQRSICFLSQMSMQVGEKMRHSWNVTHPKHLRRLADVGWLFCCRAD